jgi:hypothetical protein
MILGCSIILSNLSIHPSYQSLHPTIRPSLHPSVHPSIHPCIHKSIHQSIHPSVHPSLHPSILNIYGKHCGNNTVCYLCNLCRNITYCKHCGSALQCANALVFNVGNLTMIHVNPNWQYNAGKNNNVAVHTIL